MIRIFLGYDPVESVAWHTAVHSIINATKEPVAVTPIGNLNLPEYMWSRKRAKTDSTEFSVARFMVPYLCNYDGFAIFADCDTLFRHDILKLWAQRDGAYAVQVVKHEHKPSEQTKFLGKHQAQYSYKNWSSLMLFNCLHQDCRLLTPEYVNDAPGLDLHQFMWTCDANIGQLEGNYNLLVNYDEYDPYAPMVHFTQGGPWHGYADSPYGAEWVDTFVSMLGGTNPMSRVRASIYGDSVLFRGGYGGLANESTENLGPATVDIQKI